MRSIIFWGLLPFILPQAIYVRKTAPRFAGAAGPRRGAAGTGKNYDLIAIGDSIIAGVGAKTLAKALVGQTAEKLFHVGKIDWGQLRPSIWLNGRGYIQRQAGPVLPLREYFPPEPRSH